MRIVAGIATRTRRRRALSSGARSTPPVAGSALVLPARSLPTMAEAQMRDERDEQREVDRDASRRVERIDGAGGAPRLADVAGTGNTATPTVHGDAVRPMSDDERR